MTIGEKIVDNALAYGELVFWCLMLGFVSLINLPYEYIYLPLKKRKVTHSAIQK